MSIRATLAALIRPPRRSQSILLVIAVVLAAVIAWYFGLDPWHAIGIGTAVLAVGIVWISMPDVHPVSWEPAAFESRPGGRQDVMHLSWLLRGRRGLVGDGAQRRVRGIARTRLAGRRLDLDDPDDAPAIEALIGREAYAILRPRQAAQASLTALTRSLDALDRLDRRVRPAPGTGGPRTARTTRRKRSPDGR